MLISRFAIDGTPIKQMGRYSEKRIRLKCDSCGKITETCYANYTNSQTKRRWDLKTFCRSCTSRKTGKSRKGMPNGRKGFKFPESQRGPNSKNWTGGTYIGSDGYRIVYTGDRGLKLNNKWDRYQREHRMIMERFLKRRLSQQEKVHHIDGDKLNNDIKNLALLENERQHRIVHNSLLDVAKILYKLGFIGYNRKKNKYYLVKTKIQKNDRKNKK